MRRKVARKVVSKAKGQKREKITISGKNLSDFQGIQKYRDLVAEKKSEIGAAVGLAWT
jgi:ATP-dependent Lon protease